MTVKCGHKATTGKPCNQAAGWGTSHPGIGFCKYHDGNAPLAGRHPPLLQLLDPDQRPLVINMMENDAAIFDLRFEIAVLKQRFARLAGNSESTTRSLTDLSKAITGATSKLREMEVGKHHYIHVNILGLVLQAVGQVAGQYVPVDDRPKFSADLKNEVRRLIPHSTSRGVAASTLADRIVDVE